MMWQYYTFRTLGVIVRLLPKRINYFIASLLAEILYLACPRQRRNVNDNIRHVLGDQTGHRRVRQTSRAVFRNWAKNYVDFLMLPHLNMEKVSHNLTINGWPHFEEALSQKKGVILASAHLGSFDLAPQFFQKHSIRMNAMVELLQPESLFRYISSLRESHGVTLIPANTDGVSKCLQVLAQGEVIGIVCDRDIQGKSLKMKFFGEETTFPVGPITLALRSGAIILPTFCVRGAKGKTELHIEPPLTLNAGNRHQTARPNLEKLIAVMEQYISRYPEQWVVLEPIWPKNHIGDNNAKGE